MPYFKLEKEVGIFDPRRGRMKYVFIEKEIADQFEGKKPTRIRCTLDGQISYSCALNHFGDGNFHVVVATKYLKKLKKDVGDILEVEIIEDPNPLGVEIPEVLEVLLEQDEEVHRIFHSLTDGMKRSFIHGIKDIKDLDIQVQKTIEILQRLDFENKRKKLKNK